MVGYNTGSDAKIKRCYASGDVSGTDVCVGGIAGWNSGDSIVDCRFEGNTVSNNNYVSGVVGRNYGNGSLVKNCFFTGNVSGISNIGGIAGINETNLIIQNCVVLNSTITQTGDDGRIGCIVGFNSGMLTDNYSANITINKNIIDDPSYTDGETITYVEYSDLNWWQSIGFTDAWWSDKLPPVFESEEIDLNFEYALNEEPWWDKKFIPEEQDKEDENQAE